MHKLDLKTNGGDCEEYGPLCCRTDVSEEPAASILRVEAKKPAEEDGKLIGITRRCHSEERVFRN
jgi:hypothetical protein